MADKDIEKMFRIYQLKLYEVLDYLVIAKQYNEVEKMKNSKNAIAI